MNTKVACSNPTCATTIIVDATNPARRRQLTAAGWRLEIQDNDVTPTWYCSRCADT